MPHTPAQYDKSIRRGQQRALSAQQDTEGYAAAYRDGRWRIINRFGVVVKQALTWPTYKDARKRADLLNEAVFAGQFK